MAVNSIIAEMKVRNEWIKISIEDALHRFDRSRTKRCPECGGQVQAHAEGAEGHPAHFEHVHGHVGCSLSIRFTGTRTKHPKPCV